MMSPERKAGIVETIVAKFTETGLRPARRYYRSDQGRCACAVGVMSPAGRGYGSTFMDRFGVDPSFLAGVLKGFDGDQDRGPGEIDGYEVGAAVWARVKHLAVEVSP